MLWWSKGKVNIPYCYTGRNSAFWVWQRNTQPMYDGAVAQQMNDGRKTQAEGLIANLWRHPRVAYQQIAVGEEASQKLKNALPEFIPFGYPRYKGLLAILDWDHRLPSQNAILRIYAYYTETTFHAGEAELAARNRQIELRDKFPEFDVPDFAGLTADEHYEGELSTSGELGEIRLISTWRRDIDHKESRVAIQVTRGSDEFRKISQESHDRPDYLGDLEAVNWTPPCESKHHTWTIDVWYLMELNAAEGRGHSFLVDPKSKTVVATRQFVVHSG
ncbi:MAG: hypothetical protein V1754_14240 [Pseudomonadota bacterium]